MNKIIKGVILAFFIILALSSCKSKRPLIKAPLKEEGPEYLYTKLKENEFRFDWMSAKIDANYSEKRSSSDFKGQVRIRKDSLIWLSVSPAFGIEMFRIVITNDSVKYVNRLSKEYFIGDYRLVNDFLQIHMDFDILQSLILGNDFQFYETNSFRASVDALDYRLSTTGRRRIRKEAEEASQEPIILLQNIWLSPETFKIIQIDVKEYLKDNRKLSASYGNFESKGDQLFPSVQRYEIEAEETVKMKVSFNRITINEPMSFPFSVPENYKLIR